MKREAKDAEEELTLLRSSNDKLTAEIQNLEEARQTNQTEELTRLQHALNEERSKVTQTSQEMAKLKDELERLNTKLNEISL